MTSLLEFVLESQSWGQGARTGEGARVGGDARLREGCQRIPDFEIRKSQRDDEPNKFLIMLGQAFVTALLFPGVLIQTRLSGTTYKSMELLVDV